MPPPPHSLKSCSKYRPRHQGSPVHLANRDCMSEMTTPAAAAPASNILSVLRNRNFLFLWLAHLLSQTAQQMINYVLLVQVDSLSQSSTAVAGIILAFTLPAVLLSAIAGVFV